MLNSAQPGERTSGFFRSIEIPQALRALVRAREAGLIALAALIGVIAGLVVALMGFTVSLMHRSLYGIPLDQRLSGQTHIETWAAIAMPTLGGALFGFGLWVLVRVRPGREVDPIEANALHGGRMSFRGSMIVALQTVWSSGVGASVGLEAGYTQFASGIASWIGQAFRLRRRDLRVLVGCGAAGAIAGAFGAPLAGAFYAFELVIASYSVAYLAPVGIAALTGYLVASALGQPPLGIGGMYVSHVRPVDLATSMLVGVLAAIVGITLMRSVALCEELLNRVRIRPIFRPTLGGLIVGAIAIITPEVMSSGHGAIHISSMYERSLSAIALLFVLKSAASIVSLGTGFRGGLFFASLLIGALGGRMFADAANIIWPAAALEPHIYAIVGMGALSVAVIGGPLTMTFIALETTGDFWLTTAVLIAIIIAAQVTRETFGYSFATWRFHLRGEGIRSAADVGWIRELTVRRMMRTDVKIVPLHTTISRFRLVYPLGSVSHVAVVDEEKRYAGIISVSEAHAPDLSETKQVRDVMQFKDTALFPTMTIKEAVIMFDHAEAEALAVVDSPDKRDVVGLLTESYALRRYSSELEQRRQEILGE
ncbi:MAG TPA: chloride channel protein [Pseudolabrys sp.]|jgi:CIC family chloride channel protein|nr:chloride channel protein [Pseudolabrys sp.]